MKKNKRIDVDREPDLQDSSATPSPNTPSENKALAMPAIKGQSDSTSPFRGVVISGVVLVFIFILYLFWNDYQANQIQKQQQIELEAKRLADQKLAEQKERELIAATMLRSQEALQDTRWDDAETSVLQVLEINPDHAEAKVLLVDIRHEKLNLEIIRAETTFITALSNKDLAAAKKSLQRLRTLDSENSDLSLFDKQLSFLEEQVAKQRKEAKGIYQQALKLDKGYYSGEAITLLQKAQKLHPESQAIGKLLNKISSYTSVIKVPGDFPTIQQAINAARPRDLIEVAKGVYQESLTLNRPINIKGVVGGLTRIEYAENDASVLSIGKGANGTTLTGLVIKHTGFDYSEERFSAVTCQAKDVTVNACTIEQAMGHGIAVIDGANATISFCKISNSGWDGISVYGAGSSARIKDTLCEGNMQHGIQLWKGGSATISKSFALSNNYCGIAISSPSTQSSITASEASKNREAGIFISGGSVKAVSNTCHENINSGIVARNVNTTVSITANSAKRNQEAGIMIEEEVKVLKLDRNVSQYNLSE